MFLSVYGHVQTCFWCAGGIAYVYGFVTANLKIYLLFVSLLTFIVKTKNFWEINQFKWFCYANANVISGHETLLDQLEGEVDYCLSEWGRDRTTQREACFVFIVEHSIQNQCANPRFGTGQVILTLNTWQPDLTWNLIAWLDLKIDFLTWPDLKWSYACFNLTSVINEMWWRLVS